MRAVSKSGAGAWAGTLNRVWYHMEMYSLNNSSLHLCVEVNTDLSPVPWHIPTSHFLPEARTAFSMTLMELLRASLWEWDTAGFRNAVLLSPSLWNGIGDSQFTSSMPTSCRMAVEGSPI